MADEAYGVDIRARLQGASEVRSQATGITESIKRLGGSLRQSATESHAAGRSYEYASQRMRLFGHAAIGMRERSLGMAGAMLGVSGAVFGVEEVVRRSVDAFDTQRRSLAQTQAVLKSTGGAANITAGQIGTLAEHISRTSGIEADQIQQAENMMLTFRDVRNETGRNNDIFNQSTRAAVNMSAAFTSAGKSMTISDAALQLGKALNDPARGMTRLQRIGVVFTKHQIDQAKALEASGDRLGAQRIILGELTKEFGGSAAAVATPTMKLQATVHQLEETFGRGLMPIIDSVDKSLIGLADRATPAMTRFSGDVKRVFGDRNLNFGEKITALGRNAKMDLGPFAEHLEQQLKAAHLGDKLEQAVEFAAPRMAEGAAHAAPKVIAAFAGAWWHADIWGKLLISGVALRRLGLLGALTGRLFGARFAAGAAPGAAVAEAEGAAGAAARVGVTGGLLSPAGEIVAAGALAVGGGWEAGKLLNNTFVGRGIRSIFGVSDTADRAANERAMRARGMVQVRLTNGVPVWENRRDAAFEVHVHHATYLDGKVVARNTTKHAVDAAARR